MRRLLGQGVEFRFAGIRRLGRLIKRFPRLDLIGFFTVARFLEPLPLRPQPVHRRRRVTGDILFPFAVRRDLFKRRPQIAGRFLAPLGLFFQILALNGQALQFRGSFGVRFAERRPRCRDR